jgi:hypothetical protein
MNDNRVLVALASPLLLPFLEQKFGIKLTLTEAGDLVGLAVLVYHGLAAVAAKACAAFLLYFPPPARPVKDPLAIPQQSAEPTKVAS